MGAPHAYQATVLQERKQNPRCRMDWKVQMGLQECPLFTINRDGGLITKCTLFLEIPFFPAVFKKSTTPKAQAAAMNDLCPFPGWGWVVLSPRQDVVITNPCCTVSIAWSPPGHASHLLLTSCLHLFLCRSQAPSPPSLVSQDHPVGVSEALWEWKSVPGRDWEESRGRWRSFYVWWVYRFHTRSMWPFS